MMRRALAIVVVPCLLAIGGGHAMAWYRCPIGGAPAPSCCCPDANEASPCPGPAISGSCCCEIGAGEAAATSETRSNARAPSPPVVTACGAPPLAVTSAVIRPTVRREHPPDTPSLLDLRTSFLV